MTDVVTSVLSAAGNPTTVAEGETIAQKVADEAKAIAKDLPTPIEDVIDSAAADLEAVVKFMKDNQGILEAVVAGVVAARAAASAGGGSVAIIAAVAKSLLAAIL